MQLRSSVFGLLILTVSTNLTASETVQQYSLENLVELALSRSDQITSQKARIEEKQEAALQARAWQNPEIGVGAGAKISSPSAGPLFQASLSQLFYFPGKQDLRKEVLDFERNLEEIRLQEAELAITVDVVRLAYEHAINERKAKFAESRRKRFELIRAYVAGHTFASPQQKTTTIIVKEKLKNISADEKQLQGALQANLQQLNFYVARDSEKIPEISVPWLQGKRVANEDEWVKNAISHNVELAGQRVLVDQAAKEKELISKEALPDFSVSAFYGLEKAGQAEHTFGVGLSIPLPILNQNQAGIRSKEHKMRAEKYTLSLKEQKIASLIKKLLAEYVASQKIVSGYSEDSIAALESQMQSMEREFRRNRVDFLLFLELDIQAAETVNRVLNAQLSLADTIASLYLLARDKNLIAELSTF